jgi:AcrR family transcriptional regulator
LCLFLKFRMMTVSFKNKNKINLIIEAAQRLFGIYGIEKVSMLEIANELKLSKASLYYYFPDKESLYKAVLEKEHMEFISTIAGIKRTLKNPEKMLKEYVTLRLEYFSRLMNLSRLRLEVYSDLKPVFRETFLIFKEKEKELIIEIFKMGVKTGRFHIKDIDRTASLFLDLLKGLRIAAMKDRRTFVIEPEEYKRLLERTKVFTEIFIKGLENR